MTTQSSGQTRSAGLRLCLRKDDRGVVAALAAIAAPLLLVFAGLGAEGGLAYFRHAEMLSVSSAAALSAAAAYNAGASDTQAQIEATAVAASLGYVNGRDVAVTVTPVTGASGAKAIHVRIAYQQPLYLLKMFAPTMALAAQSVASATTAAPSVNPACILALDPTGAGALHLGGNPTVSVPNCDVIVDSSNDAAMTGNGNGRLIAASLDMVGGTSLRGNVSVPPKRTITSPVADPYALARPAASPCLANPPTVTSPVPAGVYCGGLTLKNGRFTLQGTYVALGGDLNIAANASVTGTGVTLIAAPDGTNSSARVNVAANASLKISAPSGGPYAGVAVFAAAGTAAAPDSVTWNGTSNIDVTGAIYMPHTALTLSGDVSANGAKCTQIVAWRIAFQGDAALGSDCAGVGTRVFGVPTSGSSASGVALIE